MIGFLNQYISIFRLGFWIKKNVKVDGNSYFHRTKHLIIFPWILFLFFFSPVLFCGNMWGKRCIRSFHEVWMWIFFKIILYSWTFSLKICNNELCYSMGMTWLQNRMGVSSNEFALMDRNVILGGMGISSNWFALMDRNRKCK